MGLNFIFSAEDHNLMSTVHNIAAGVQDATRQIEANGGDIDRVINMIKHGVATLGIGLGFKEIVSQVASTRDEFQKLEITFNTLLGSEEKANALMSQLIKTAAITPFSMSSVTEGAKGLLAYGVAAEEVNDTLVGLGDIAAGLKIPLTDLTYLYGTTITQGRMFTQDLRQFQGRGIPIADEIATILGITKEKVGDAVTAGKVTSEVFIQAMKNMTAEGSKFGGLMEAQSKSLGGQWENIKDSIEQMFNEIGKSTEGIMNTTLSATSAIVENWQSVLLILGDVAAAYGAQKALVMLDSSFTTAATNYGYDAEIAQLRALLPVKEQAAKTDLEQAEASGLLTKAKAEQIAALREEANAQLEALAAKEAAAKAEEAAAIKKAEAAAKELADGDELVKTYAERLEAITQVGDAEEIEAALTELETAEALRNEAANLSLAASEEARTAATNAAAASEARETLATQINTAQTASNSAATGILTIAKEKLAAAITKVNAVMKANQFAIVTGAVIALGYAIYKLLTYQTEEQKMLEKVSKATTELDIEIAKETKTLDRLQERLNKTTKGTDAWKDVKNEIVSKYGSYFKNLDSEIEKTGSLASTYDELTKAVKKSMVARKIAKFEEDNKVDVTDELNEVRELLSGTFNYNTKSGLVKNQTIPEDLQREFMQQYSSYLTDFDETKLDARLRNILQSNGGRNWYGQYSTYLSRGVKKREELERNRQGAERIAQNYGFSYTEIIGNTLNEEDKKKSIHDKAYWEQQKKGAESRLEALSDIAAAGKEGEKIKKEIEGYNQKLKAFSTKEEKGATAAQLASKTLAEEQQLTDLLKRQAAERLRQQQSYEYELWQNRIDLMKEGEAKVLAQMQLDNAKEITALKERQEQEIQAEIAAQKAVFDAREDVNASKDKKYAKQVFDPAKDVDTAKIAEINQRYEQLYTDLAAKQAKAEQDRIDAAKESMNAYLQEFGNYQQKRLAIQEEYETKIAEAQNAGERMQLIAQRNQKISDLDFNEWQDNGGMALAFGDVSKLSGDTIKELISKMEEYRSKVIATFDPDKIQKFEDALNNLRMADVDMQFHFGENSDIVESLKERLALVKQINDEEANTAALQNQKAELEQQLNDLVAKSLTPTLNTSAIGPDGQPAEQTGVGMTEEDLKLAKELMVKIMQIGNLLTKSATNSQQLNSQLKQMQNVKFADVQKFSKNLLGAAKNAASLAEIFDDDIADAVSSGINKVEGLIDVFDTVSSSIETLAKAGKDVVNSTVDASKQIVDGASTGMKASAAATATSLSTMEKASAILAIIGAAIQLATMVASLFNSDKKHEKNIGALQDKIDALQKSYNKLGKAADDAFSTDASDLIDQQNILLQQQKVLIRQQMAEEEAKKKTDDEKIKEYKERLEEIDETLADNKKKAKEAIVGEDIKSAIKDFSDAYSSAWENGTDAASKSMSAVKNILKSALTELLNKNLQPKVQEFYDLVAKYAEGGFTEAELNALDAIKRQIDAASQSMEEQFKTIENRYKDLDELKEELTDISFDSVRDNFKSQLLDMEADASDFTASFTDMLRSAVVEGLMDNKYDAMLKEWYDEFAEAMDDQTLTDEERDSLRQRYESIINQGIADRNAVSEIIGGGAYSQEASTGGWESMGQDQAEELNGRFTALTELQVISNDLQQTQNTLSAQILATLQGMSLISGTANGNDPTLLAIKDMMFLQTGYLEDIAQYTRILNSVDERLATLNNSIDRKL